MSIEQRLSATLNAERAKKSGAQAARLNDIAERFEKLVNSGAVEVERYNLAPITPTSLTSRSVIA
jgi:hypothetical protein